MENHRLMNGTKLLIWIMILMIYIMHKQYRINNIPKGEAVKKKQLISIMSMNVYRKSDNMSTKEDLLKNRHYCKNVTKPRHNANTMLKGVWHTDKISIEKQDKDIFAMHAYYDDRPALHGNNTIRIFIITTIDNKKWIQPLNCYVWFEYEEHPILVPAESKGLNRIVPIVDDISYNSHVISCYVSNINFMKITHISLTNSSELSNCQRSYLYVPVVYPLKPDTFEHTFGMCEANGVSFGHYNDSFAPWLIEWFEANMMFGITEFNIYNATLTVSPNVQKVLDYYQEKGHLIFHQHPTPLEKYNQFHRPSADIAMRTALHDCIYRNMYRYKYVVGIDLDEIIVPQQHENYYDMLKSRENERQYKNLTQSFSVPARGYYQTFVEDNDNKIKSKYPLLTSQYINSVYDGRKKSFTNPRLCVGAFSHNCMREISGAPNTTETLSSDLGIVHHYRHRCSKWDYKPKIAKCLTKFNEREKHDRMKHFQKVLFDHVSMVAQKIEINLEF